MVEEKLKRSTKQPKAVAAAPTPVAAARSAAAARPGAFIPREPTAAASASGGSTPLVAAALVGGAFVGGDEAATAGYGGGSYGAPRQLSEGLEYSRPGAFTPPNALATPMPQRPSTSYAAPQYHQRQEQQQCQQQQQYAAPTPVPAARPYTAPAAAAAHADAADDADFDVRWSESLAGIACASVDDAVEHIKALCGDIMLALQVGWGPEVGVGGSDERPVAVCVCGGGPSVSVMCCIRGAASWDAARRPVFEDG